MQFMALFSLNPEKAQTPPPAELSEAEFEAVRGLYMESLVRQIWVRNDGSGAFAIVEAASAGDATEKLGRLPMVRAGVLEAPVVVALSPYWGFAPRAK